jgi:hypothetical protein
MRWWPLLCVALAACFTPVEERQWRDGGGLGGADAGPDSGEPSADGGDVSAGATGSGDAGWARQCPLNADGGRDRFSCQEAPLGLARCAQVLPFACSTRGADVSVEGDWLLHSDLQRGAVVYALSGAVPPRTLSAAPERAQPSALRDGFAYWFTDTFTLMRAPVEGGPAVALASAAQRPLAMAVGATHVYWATGTIAQDTIVAVSVAGGAPQVMVSGEKQVDSIAVDDGALYWADILTGTIRTQALAGGTARTLFSGQRTPHGLEWVAGFLYWSEFTAQGALWRGPPAGGAAQRLASGLDYPATFVTDGTTLYAWPQGGAPRVVRVSAAGGALQTLFTTATSGLLALSPSALYLDNGGVWALPR